MLLCTKPNNCYGHHKCCIYVCCWNKCENTRSNTRLFLYVLVNPFNLKKIKIYTLDETQGQSKG